MVYLKTLADLGALAESDLTEAELETLARNCDFFTRMLYQKVAANKARVAGNVQRARQHEEDAEGNSLFLDPEARWF